MNELIETDILIIGCGIAGGTAALLLADTGIDVTIITRTEKPAESSTKYAQGGIIYRGDEEDSQELLKALYTFGWSILITIAVGYFLIRLFPKTPFFSKITLETVENSQNGYKSAEIFSDFVGIIGFERESYFSTHRG